MLTAAVVEPSKIVRPAAKFALAVVSRTGLDSLSLSLDAAKWRSTAGKTIAQEKAPLGRLSIELAPGAIRIREIADTDGYAMYQSSNRLSFPSDDASDNLNRCRSALNQRIPYSPIADSNKENA